MVRSKFNGLKTEGRDRYTILYVPGILQYPDLLCTGPGSKSCTYSRTQNISDQFCNLSPRPKVPNGKLRQKYISYTATTILILLYTATATTQEIVIWTAEKVRPARQLDS